MPNAKPSPDFFPPICSRRLAVILTSISGLTSAGIFAAVESLGAEGLIPIRTLPDDDYQLRNCGFELFGTRSGRTFMFGDVIRARLTEASPVTGG